jgi:hypothetical protein
MIVPGDMAHDSFEDEDFIVLEEVIRLSANPLPFKAGKWQGQTDVKDLIDTGHLNKEAQPDKVKSSQKETKDSNNAKEIHTIDFIVLEAVICQSANPLPFQTGQWQGQTDVQNKMATGHLNKAQPDNVKSCQEETKDSNNTKEIHTIYVLKKTDGTAFGWAFIGFYDIRECIRSICNHNSGVTTLGSKNFKPFTNLSIQWVLTFHLDQSVTTAKVL